MPVIKDYYDIVILPPPDVNQYCIDLSRKIKTRYGAEFSLGKTRYRPHISLLHTAFPQRNLKPLKRKLTAIANNTKPFKIRITEYLNYPEYASITLKTTPKSNFLPLYQAVIDSTKNLIDRNFDYLAVWPAAKSNRKAREYIKQYTTPLVNENFIPHITLNSLNNKQDICKVEKEFKITPQQFTADNLSLCTLADSQTCQDIVFSLPLK